MWKIKLREQQAPVLLRDGKGGPMRRVTADDWAGFVGFEELPDYIALDESLIKEKSEGTGSGLGAGVASVPPLADQVPDPVEAPAPRKRRRGRPRKTPLPENTDG